jgi:hypothetical protein
MTSYSVPASARALTEVFELRSVPVSHQLESLVRQCLHQLGPVRRRGRSRSAQSSRSSVIPLLDGRRRRWSQTSFDELPGRHFVPGRPGPAAGDPSSFQRSCGQVQADGHTRLHTRCNLRGIPIELEQLGEHAGDVSTCRRAVRGTPNNDLADNGCGELWNREHHRHDGHDSNFGWLLRARTKWLQRLLGSLG